MGLSFFGWKKGSDILRDTANSVQNTLGHGNTADDEDDKLDMAIRSGDPKQVQHTIDNAVSQSSGEIYMDFDNGPSEKPVPVSWENVRHRTANQHNHGG